MRDYLSLAAVGAGVGLVGLLVVYIVGKKAVASGAINPASRNNLIYGGANDIGAAVSGGKDFNLGAWIWEKTHPAAVARESEVTLPSVATPPYFPPTVDYSQTSNWGGA